MTIAVPEFSVQPFATVPVDGDAADLLDRVADALESDPRAIGAVVGYDYDSHRVGAIFQVDVGSLDGPDAATRIAVATFDKALTRAGIDTRCAGCAVVEGDDPDQLP